MPTTLNPTTPPTFAGSMTAPAAGDARTAASVQTPLTRAINNDKWLSNRLAILKDKTPGFAASGRNLLSRPIPLTPIFDPASTWLPDKTPSTGGNVTPTIRQYVTNTNKIHLWLPRAPYGKLVVCGIVCQGNSHSSLPAVLPTVALMRRAFFGDGTDTDGVWNTVDGLKLQSDAPADANAYDRVHTISLNLTSPDVSFDVDPHAAVPYDFWLEVVGENGANSVAGGFSISGVFAQYQAPAGVFDP